MHDMPPEHIHEEIELQDMDFASYQLEWLCAAPAWRHTSSVVTTKTLPVLGGMYCAACAMMPRSTMAE